MFLFYQTFNILKSKDAHSPSKCGWIGAARRYLSASMFQRLDVSALCRRTAGDLFDWNAAAGLTRVARGRKVNCEGSEEESRRSVR